ncbi:MAG: hypothetical protein HZB16_15790 [Armatimonadetes bacterium]|nr:hypothetical protein [Armatimonadota bacterium]
MERTAEVKEQQRDREPERREWQAPVVVDLLGQPRGIGNGGACLSGSSDATVCGAGGTGPGT